MSEGTAIPPFRKRLGLRVTAGLMALIMLLTTVLYSMGRVSVDPSEYANDAESAAAGYLVENNNYINQNSLLRGGQAAVAAVSVPRSFDDFYRLAEIAIARRQYGEALEAIDRCLTLDDAVDSSLTATLWLKHGSLLTLLGDHEQALVSLKKATDLDVDLADAWLVQVELYIGDEIWPQAVQCLNVYLDLKPDDSRMYGVMGELLAIIGDYRGAVTNYTISLETNNAIDAHVYLLRGGCLIQVGDYQKAVDDFNRAAQYGADEDLCRENLALCHLLLEDYQAVLVDGAPLISSNQASAELAQRMGVAAMALEQTDKARALFSRSIGLNKDLPTNYYYRGVCHMSLKQYQDACVDFAVSIQRGEMLQPCYYNRGVCYLKLEEFEMAQADMEKTLEAGNDVLLNKSARDVLNQLKKS